VDSRSKQPGSIRDVASGGPVVLGPPFEICAPPFTFGPLVAAYIQYSIFKMWPPFLVFGPPWCYILATGLGSIQFSRADFLKTYITKFSSEKNGVVNNLLWKIKEC